MACVALLAETLICGSILPEWPRAKMESSQEVTQLLQAWRTGDSGVEERLFGLLLPDLRRVAQHLMRRERPDHSLETTGLLNEAYCRLVNARERDWQNRQHFLAVAARAMRRLLIDYARGRGDGQRIPLEALEALLPRQDGQLQLAVSVDALLDELEASHPDWCSIVEMKFFMGLTDEETAEALGLSLRTVQRKFGDARRWLFQRLQTPQGNPNKHGER